MGNDPPEDTTGSESGLSDDDFSPVLADDDRPRIPRVADEREALMVYLEYYRATVAMKCRGVSPEQARTRSMPPSTLSIHGLIRHLAGVERWFQQNFERRDVPFLFFTADNPDLDFDLPLDADFAGDLETWRGECVVPRAIVGAHDLDDTARKLDWEEDVDLRWLVLRMITEYAQHCGHIDLIREGVNGSTGGQPTGGCSSPRRDWAPMDTTSIGSAPDARRRVHNRQAGAIERARVAVDLAHEVWM